MSAPDVTSLVVRLRSAMTAFESKWGRRYASPTNTAAESGTPCCPNLRNDHSPAFPPTNL